MPPLRPGTLAIIAALLAVLVGHDVGMATMAGTAPAHRHHARVAVHHHADRAAEEAPGRPPGCASVRAVAVQRAAADIDGSPAAALATFLAQAPRDRVPARPGAAPAALPRPALQVWRI